MVIQHQAELLNGFRHFGLEVCHMATCTTGVSDKHVEGLCKHVGIFCTAKL